MKFQIQPILNSYLLIRQTEPQIGEFVLHVSEVEYFTNQLRKAAQDYVRLNSKAMETLPPPSFPLPPQKAK